jgi:hypothetical protein
MFGISIVDFLFGFSEILFIISFISRDMLVLRALTVIGTIGYIFGALVTGYDEPGMKAIIVFNVILTTLNIVQIYFLVITKTQIMIPDELKPIYNKCFTSLEVPEFLSLMKLSKKTYLKENDLITTEGLPVNNIMLIDQGNVEVTRQEKHLVDLHDGYFIGEMSFITGEAANASVKVSSGNADCFKWEKTEIERLEESNPPLYSKFKEVLAINLIKKIDKLSTSEAV